MSGSITDVPGIEVGHADDPAGGTGCTVVLCRGGAVPGVDSRGGAPATRETDCLRPENVVPIAHAVFLTGGSAYGLDCAGGIMRCLEEQGVGFQTGAAVVPIVAGAALNDLAFGDPRARPDAAMGYAACRSASAPETRQGNVGAGMGACIGRLAGNARGMMKGGLGTASLRVGELVVGVIVAVNCNGDVLDPETNRILAGTLTPDEKQIAGARNLLLCPAGQYREGFPTNTTIGVVATNAALTKAMATRVAMMVQDGYARAIHPIHTLGDGDVSFCLGAGVLKADINRVGALAAWAMGQAIVNAVQAAETLHGVPCSRELLGRKGP
jgi:L-aminopeptidase/D-esterase-like protein